MSVSDICIADIRNEFINGNLTTYRKTIARCPNFLEESKFLETTDQNGLTPLQLAVVHGRTAVFCEIFERYPSDILMSDFPYVQYAVKAGNPLLAIALIRLGATLKDVLPLAVESGFADVVHELILKGADVEVGSPVITATVLGHAEIVKLLILAGAKSSVSRLLYWAVQHENIEVVKTLLELKSNEVTTLIDVNIGIGTKTPLHMAATKGVEFCKLLVEAGADIERLSPCIPVYGQCTALHLAVQSGNEEIVNYLLSVGANPNSSTSNGYRPLHMAAIYCPTESMFNRLIHAGADPHAKNNDGCKFIDLRSDI